MSDHSRVDDFFQQQVSLKPQPTEYKKAETTMSTEDYIKWVEALTKADVKDNVTLELTEDMEYVFF